MVSGNASQTSDSRDTTDGEYEQYRETNATIAEIPIAVDANETKFLNENGDKTSKYANAQTTAIATNTTSGFVNGADETILIVPETITTHNISREIEY